LVTELTGLVTLTFDLSTSKLGHGSPVSWASFLPIFSFCSRFRIRHRTDRGTDTQQPSMHYAQAHSISRC